jgi:hypothetical protein
VDVDLLGVPGEGSGLEGGESLRGWRSPAGQSAAWHSVAINGWLGSLVERESG